MGRGGVGPQALAHLHPIHDWHHKVEEDHVGLPLVRHLQSRAIAGGHDLIACVVQGAAEQLDDGLIIVYDEDQSPDHTCGLPLFLKDTMRGDNRLPPRPECFELWSRSRICAGAG